MNLVNGRSLQPVIMILLVLLWGCERPLPRNVAEEVIIKHFEKRHYDVTDLSIGAISPIGLREKQYMGTEAHVVNVTTVTLALKRDLGAPWNYRKGQHLRFTDAVIKIKRTTGGKEEWIIADVSGIPVP